ncbi:hypothetical protein TNCV_3976071 [Trichonephila clavipes]|nr:hypothetical protein TNCV_3976071 [Trichonephila clavipes]
MPADRQCRIEAQEIRHGKGLDCTPVLNRSFEHHSVGSTIWLSSAPILKKNALERDSFSTWGDAEGNGASSSFDDVI